MIKPLLIAGALVLGVAAPASADSVAYINGGNVWLTTTDGARQFQVTTTGGYDSVSQADDGTLMASNAAHHLVAMDRLGNIKSEITALSGASSGSYMSFNGPYNVDISPDGLRTAYGFIYQGIQQSTYDGSISASIGNGAAVSRTASDTGVSEPGYKMLKSWDAPEWIDNGNLLVSNGPGYPSDPVAVSAAGSGDEKGWFSDPDNVHPMEATISRNKRVLADVKGPDRSAVYVYRDDDGELLGGVHRCFFYSDPNGKFKMSDPTLNADGSRLWYANGTGLSTAPMPNMKDDCGTGVDTTEIIPGASSPDWGPADVPTSRPAPAVTATPTATVHVNPTPTPEVQPTVTLDASAAGGAAKKVARRGLSVTVTAPVAGSVSATAKLGAKVVGRGSVAASAAGRVALKVKFTKAGAKRVKTARGKTLSVTVAAGSATKTVSVPLS